MHFDLHDDVRFSLVVLSWFLLLFFCQEHTVHVKHDA